MDYAELARVVVKKLVYWTDDKLIDVKEKRRPLQISKTTLEKAKLNEDIRPRTAEYVRVIRKRHALHRRINANRIVRDADKAKRTAQTVLDRRIKPIDVKRRIAIPPFETEDVHRILVFHPFIIP